MSSSLPGGHSAGVRIVSDFRAVLRPEAGSVPLPVRLTFWGVRPMSKAVNAGGSPSAPGGPSPAGSVFEGSNSAKRRSAFYIDGFNFYHALDELGQPHLKWLDFWALGLALINKREEELQAVYWCTAEYPFNPDKAKRHLDLKRAQEIRGVTPIIGHFIEEPVECRRCRHSYMKPTEKQGDLNVGIHLIADAIQRRFDVFYLVSADSDQVATARYFAAHCSEMKLVVVAPPGKPHSRHILAHVRSHKTIKVQVIEACLLPPALPDGEMTLKRPQPYHPPQGWRRPQLPDVN